MAKRHYKYGPARLQCNDCGHRFVVTVRYVAHGVAESSERTPWVVDSIADGACPECGSRSVSVRSRTD